MDTTTSIEELIEKLTTNGGEELDRKQLSTFKKYCKAERDNNENHAQIRYSSFLIIDYLFERSRLFRLIVCENLQNVLELCLDMTLSNSRIDNSGRENLEQSSAHHKSLRPKIWANKLHTKILDRFQYWLSEFADDYPTLSHYHKLLIEKKAFTVQQSSVQWQRIIPNETIEQLRKDFYELENDVNLLIIQIDSCFELLIPKINIIENNECNNQTNDNHSNIRPMQGLSFNIILVSKIEIVRDKSNNVIIDNLHELCKELNNIGRKIGLLETQSKFANDVLGDDIKQLRMKIVSILSKENDIKIIEESSPSSSSVVVDNDDSDDLDEDDFEEVAETEDKILLAKMEQDKNEKNQQVMSSTIIAENQCRALLPSGRLCPRRDLINCPFHGKIIPRDEEGLPLDGELRQQELDAKFQRESNEWKDPRYLRILSEQIGKDLRLNIKRKRNTSQTLINLKQLNSTPRQRLKSKLKIKLKK
ncbi:hypothetical protein DERF_000252 [Dermatophagoides farinae]|uniref:UV-stimulated scaffold protein A C-terminal domain-containing protein n=1 Tax=Dermatophagoides farinae TaxID=6954 RepID=A0A922I6Z0_DERFA|nr:hypothetical protein DERF_000252 [Dermatophagoides farinae]